MASKRSPKVASPPAEPPRMLRVLHALENPAGGPPWQPGAIIPLAALSVPSIPILMERGIVMPYLDPAWIAALPEL